MQPVRKLGFIYTVIDGAWTPRYVGMTTAGCDQRFARHVLGVHRNDPLTRHLPFHRWLAKHLDEAQVVELERGTWTRAELGARERAWIEYFGFETLFNVSRGGYGGWAKGGSREQALKAWETRRARGTDTWVVPEDKRRRGYRGRGGWSVEWREANPDKEQARIAAVAAANKQRDHRWAGVVVIDCKCGCGTQLERSPSNVDRAFVDREHYLAYMRSGRIGPPAPQNGKRIVREK